MLEKDLYVTTQNNYGTELIYPECKSSIFLCYKTKTITKEMKAHWEDMGFTLNVRAKVLWLHVFGYWLECLVLMYYGKHSNSYE